MQTRRGDRAVILAVPQKEQIARGSHHSVMFKALGRLSSKARYWTIGLLLAAAGITLIVLSLSVTKSDGRLTTVLASVGAGLIPTGTVVFLEPWLVENISTSTKEIARSSAEKAVRESKSSMPTTVTVLCNGEPIDGAEVLALAPNKTWKHAEAASDGNAYLELHTTDQPLTVFVGADRHGAHVEPGWIPAKHELTINLVELPEGGSCVFRQGTGYIPGLSGRLNPILDTRDRTYVYANNIAVNGGQAQPVTFTREIDMDMEDSDGNRFQVRVVEIIGRSSLIEYRRQ